MKKWIIKKSGGFPETYQSIRTKQQSGGEMSESILELQKQNMQIDFAIFCFFYGLYTAMFVLSSTNHQQVPQSLASSAAHLSFISRSRLQL